MACSIVSVATEAAEVIDRLENRLERVREQRDEARREVCNLNAEEYGATPEHHADGRGWDCFKEEGK
jgi:hypothetical protein